MPTSVPPKGDEFRRENAQFANLKVRAQDTPDMSVEISEGGFWVNEQEYVEYSGGNSLPLTPPPGSAKWVVVALSNLGAIELINGSVAASPEIPDIPPNRMPLAGVFINALDTSITQDMVFDLRPLWGMGSQVTDVSISDVDGLQVELDNKASLADLSSGLDNQADKDGTTEPTFTLNKDQTGVPGADCKLTVARGSENDVNITWNESTEIWEFTNDGAIWNPIGTGSVSASTLTQIDDNSTGVATNASAIGTLFTNQGTIQTDVTNLQDPLLGTPVVTTGSLVVDLDTGASQELTLVENVTVSAFTNPPVAGKTGEFTLILKQDGVGGRTIVWPGTVKWDTASPVLPVTSNAISILRFITVDAGLTWYGTVDGLSMV